jgi:hypothetical protein
MMEEGALLRRHIAFAELTALFISAVRQLRFPKAIYHRRIRGDKTIVTLRRFAPVTPEAPCWINTLLQAKRACDGKSLGTLSVGVSEI